MKQIIVLAEHRKQQLRDTTWEAVAAARKLSADLGAEVCAVLMGSGCDAMAQALAKECPKVMVVDAPEFEHFNPDAIIKALPAVLKDIDSFLLLMGNSNAVIDLAPGLSVALESALATDCTGLEVRDGLPVAWRQAYSYKVNTLVSFKDSQKILVTLRGGAFSFTACGDTQGAIDKVASPLDGWKPRRRFVGYVEAEKGDVDIASADIIVSIGRGIGEEPELEIFESLADAMGAVLACSRPIVDKNLLPKYHQVGTSGIEVKPKVYLALGISGAFQHVGGIKGSPVIVAVNKDPRAPIFRVAQYGIVGDLNQVVPVLTEKIQALKG